MRDLADCAKFACRADQTLGLLPLDGMPVAVVVADRMAGGRSARDAVRAAAPGGQDAVVDFQLPARPT